MIIKIFTYPMENIRLWSKVAPFDLIFIFEKMIFHLLI